MVEVLQTFGCELGESRVKSSIAGRKGKTVAGSQILRASSNPVHDATMLAEIYDFVISIEQKRALVVILKASVAHYDDRNA